MPTYEYECTACGHRFEIFQKFSDKPKTRCPVCQSKLRKVYHAAGVIFKGEGWYATDSRASSEKSKFASDKKEGGAPTTDAPATPKAEPKSEPKAEPVAAKSSGESSKSSD